MLINRHWPARAIAASLLSFALFHSPRTAAQTQPRSAAPASATTPVANADLSVVRHELFKLLRMSPKLTSVVARDPSLLANQEYVRRNNPELAQFLEEHPEIARNPEFYLFAENPGQGDNEERLEQRVWPEAVYQPDITGPIIAFFVFLFILGAVLWLLRVLFENRRWGRILKLQTEVHTKLLDRFGTSQELITYMNSEAGKRFLESTPIQTSLGPGQQARMSLMRILTPLQLGVLLMMLGTGSLLLRDSAHVQNQEPFLVLGTLGLMLGIGFIISAGLSYLLAKRMGLLPQGTAELEKAANMAAKEQM